MYSENLEDFFGLPVVDFNRSSDWDGPDRSYRLREEYEDDIDIAHRLDTLLASPDARQLRSLVIGAWSGACEGDDSAGIIQKLVDVAPQLPDLRGLFLGDITYEECEVSWINQSDVGPLLKAYPQLQEFRVRGGNGLSITPLEHQSLQTLAIETGGLPRSVLRELFQCQFPQLDHLELLLGDDSYGFDGGVEDLQPLLAGEVFPKLKYLGLMNSVISNEIAAVLVNSPIVARLGTLDLSMGNLTDEGARSLQALGSHQNLQLLILSHHYISQDVLTELQRVLPCKVIADEAQDADDDWRPVLHAE